MFEFMNVRTLYVHRNGILKYTMLNHHSLFVVTLEKMTERSIGKFCSDSISVLRFHFLNHMIDGGHRTWLN